MILIDTSAWVEFLRDSRSPVCERVEELLESDITICEPVRMEILSGARSDAHLRELRRLVARASLIETQSMDYEYAASLYRSCRHAGDTVDHLLTVLSLPWLFERAPVSFTTIETLTSWLVTRNSWYYQRVNPLVVARRSKSDEAKVGRLFFDHRHRFFPQ
jgi:predicted nucleic acid-binding protein